MAAPTLFRGLGRVEATTIIIGGVIGSGIFLGPSIVARNVGSPRRAAGDGLPGR